MTCAGCCTDTDCPCVKRCDEKLCEAHYEPSAWAAYFGLRPGMTREERLEQLEGFAPPGWEPAV